MARQPIEILERRVLLAAEAAITSPTVIDLLAVYTPAARTALGGDTDAHSFIQQALNSMNQALFDSLIPITIRLVHSEVIAYTGSGNVLTDRLRLQTPGDTFIDSIHALRDTWGADLVHMVTDGAPGAGGSASLLNTLSNPNLAFSVMDHTVLQPSNLTLAHELGHNLGAGHERGNMQDPAVGPFTYSYGYRFTGNDGVVYHDIMSYDPGLDAPLYANPNVLYQGVPTGAPIASPNEADLYSTFIMTGPSVAAYRTTMVADNSPPIASLFEVQPAGNQLTFTIRWRDDSAVDVATLGHQDVHVHTPEGFNLAAEFLGVDVASNAYQALARYRVTLPASNPPATSLTFFVNSLQVRDVAGNFTPASQIPKPMEDTAGWNLQQARHLGNLGTERIIHDTIRARDNEDIFQFSLSAMATVSMRLSGLEDEINVFVLKDANNNGIYDTGEFIAGTFKPGNADRAFARTLLPGTYYAWVHSQFFEQGDSEYRLSLRAFNDLTPPTAALDAVDVKTAGAPHVDFAVTYTDNQEIDANVARFDAAVDILVQPDSGGGFTTTVFPDFTLNGSFPQNAPSFTTFYRFLAFGGGFTAADNGLYTVSIHPNTPPTPRARDVSGNEIPLITLGSFRVAIGPDGTAPTASAQPAPILVPGAATYDFNVAYRDNVAINGSTIDSNDVRVTGPGGYNQVASFVSLTSLPTVGSTRIATYRITAPGGTWGFEDDGSYSVALQAGQVLDSTGNAAAAGTLATLNVHVPLTGDTNNDDRVNLADYNTLAANFSQAGRGVGTGDFNFDGLVNLSDYNILAGRFGTTLSSVAGSLDRKPARSKDLLSELLS